MTNKIKLPKKAKQQPRGGYPIGFAKPPDHTKFKPGNEFGKKGGRPKGRKNHATVTKEIYNFKVEIPMPGGGTRRVSLLEAMEWRTALKGANGDPRASERMTRRAEEVGIETSQPPAPDENLAPDEARTLEHFRAAIRAEILAELAAAAATPMTTPMTVGIYPDRPTVRRVVFPARAAAGFAEGAS